MINVLNGLLIISLILVSGCASSKAIYKNYDKLVNVKDGVNTQEAKIIAQRIIISTQRQNSYRITAPDIKENQYALKYPEFWFVVFGHNWFSPISMDPLASTYRELKETQFVVVINKSNGEIQFVGLWYPKRDDSFDWVFDPDMYKLKAGLALPPYEKVSYR